MRTLLCLVLAGCTAQAGSLGVIGVGGGGGAAATYDYEWHGRAACGETLHASSDCFDDAEGAGAPTGWTEWDPAGSAITLSEGARGLAITANANHDMAGAYKAYVPGNVTYTVHASTEGVWDVNTIGSRFGLALTDDLSSAPTTADIVRVASNEQSAIFGFEYWTSYTTFSASADSVANGDVVNATDAWLRICQDDDNDDLRGCISPDGRTWKCSTEVSFATALVDPPVHVALLHATGAGTAYFDAFIVTTSETDCYHSVGSYDAP